MHITRKLHLNKKKSVLAKNPAFCLQSKVGLGRLWSFLLIDWVIQVLLCQVGRLPSGHMGENTCFPSSLAMKAGFETTLVTVAWLYVSVFINA